MKRKIIEVKINNKKYKIVNKRKTIYEVLGDIGIFVPTLCYSCEFPPQGVCGLCSVEINGKGILPACSTQIENGMEISSESTLLEEIRQEILKLLYTHGHLGKCGQCSHSDNCSLLNFVLRYKAYPLSQGFSFSSSVSQQGVLFFDPSKCIKCRLCIQACKKYGSSVLYMRGFSQDTTIIPPKKGCIKCLQCARVCPVGAIVLKK